ncbi:hypothetical protein Q2388_17300, partial [Escherichia coli]|nr:hypothetical protein [Escherichia coli]
TYMFLRSETCAACGAKTRLAGGCAHCVNTTTFPNFFLIGALATKKSEPLKGPPRFFGCQWLNFRRLPD